MLLKCYLTFIEENMILNNKRHAFDSKRLWWMEVTVSTELSQVPVHNTPLNGLSKNILYVDETGLQVCVCVCVVVSGCLSEVSVPLCHLSASELIKTMTKRHTGVKLSHR